MCDGTKDCLNGHDELKDSDGNCIDGLPPLFKIIDEMANYSKIKELFDVDEKTLKLDHKSNPDEGVKIGFMKPSQFHQETKLKMNVIPKQGNCSQRCLSISKKNNAC